MAYKPLELFKTRHKVKKMTIFEQAEKIRDIITSCPWDLIPYEKRVTPEGAKMSKGIKKKLQPYLDRLVELIPRMLESIEQSIDTEQLDLQISSISDLFDLMNSLEGYACDMKSQEEWTRRSEIASRFQPIRAKMVDLIPRLFEKLEESLA